MFQGHGSVMNFQSYNTYRWSTYNLLYTPDSSTCTERGTLASQKFHAHYVWHTCARAHLHSFSTPTPQLSRGVEYVVTGEVEALKTLYSIGRGNREVCSSLNSLGYLFELEQVITMSWTTFSKNLLSCGRSQIWGEIWWEVENAIFVNKHCNVIIVSQK